MSAFMLITSFADILFILVWSIILLSYIAYRKKFAKLHKDSEYKLPGGLITCFMALLFFIFMLVIIGLNANMRTALIIAPVWIILLKLIYNFTKHPLTKY